MATVTKRIEVCDCHREFDRPIIKRVRIAPEGERLRTVAFCEEGWQLMGQVLDLIRDSWPTPAAGRRSSRRVTMEQIETIKGTKRATKSAAPRRRARKGPVAAAKS